MDCPINPDDCRHIDRALRESEERYRHTFENAAVGIAHVAPDGTWLRANRKVCEFLGYSLEELNQLTFQQLTHPEDLDKGLTAMREMFAGKQDFMNLDKRYIRKDGGIVWANLTVSCARNEAGDVAYMISVLQDITEKKQMRQALDESEARLQAFQRTSPDGFMMFASVRDASGRIVDFRCNYANPAASAFSQIPVENMIGNRMLEETPINRTLGLFDIYCQVVESGETAQGELEVPFRDGTRAWCRYTAVRMQDGFAVSFTDITDRKKVELSLQHSEARFRAVQQTTPDGFIIFSAIRDGAGRIVDFRFDVVNPAVERILDDTAANIVGDTMHKRMTAITEIGAFDRYVDVVETGEPWQGDMLYPRDTGDRWYRATAAKVGDGFAVSFSDVTAAKTNEALLQERDERLVTILNNVLGFVGMLSPEGVMLEVNETALAFAGIERSDVIGKYFWNTYWWSHDADARDELKDAISRAARGERVRYDMVIRTAGDNRMAVDFQLSPCFDEYGNVVEIIPSGVDISDRKKAEQHREMLVRELSHRVKNLLATVQTIASHTLRESTDLESFREGFVGRLVAISKSHDLLIDSRRSEASLSQLIREQVVPYARSGVTSQVHVSGPALELGPEASHAFGLVLHELATNAAKYGALSTEGGRLDITWKRIVNNGTLEVLVEWRESGGPPVTPPTRRGFGSVLIEQSLAYSLGGSARIEYRPEGFWAQFRFHKRA